jgi:hypothetical protein
MKKYQYTPQEKKAMASARKGDKKEFAGLVRKIRKQCIEEGRFEEVEKLEKKSEEETKQKPKRNAEGQFVSNKAETEETSVVIK